MEEKTNSFLPTLLLVVLLITATESKPGCPAISVDLACPQQQLCSVLASAPLVNGFLSGHVTKLIYTQLFSILTLAVLQCSKGC